MTRRILLFCLLALVPGLALGAQPASSATLAFPMRINEVHFEANWVEIFNGNDRPIDVTHFWFCRADFCKKLGDLPVLSGTVKMQPEAYAVLSWDANRNADANPQTRDGEVALYTSAPFADAGRWREGDAARVPPSGHTLSFFGGADGPALNWSVGQPTPGGRNQQVATSIDDPDEVVGEFLLTPAFPNPFNPRTQFTLTVARTQDVLVEIYNLLGRRVDVLHNGPLAGQARHSFTFEADELPSGLYLIRVVGEHFTTTQRVTLLK